MYAQGSSLEQYFHNKQVETSQVHLLGTDLSKSDISHKMELYASDKHEQECLHVLL